LTSARTRNDRALGGFFETLVCLHLRGQCNATIPPARICDWRTVSGAEVDFVIEHSRRLLAVEVNHTRRPTAATDRLLQAVQAEWQSSSLTISSVFLITS